MSQGLVCSLTGSKPDFEETCPTFHLDERVQEEMKESPAYNATEITASLSSDKLQLLRVEQNLPLAITGGILVGLVGAVLWAMITVATGWQIGYMALAIGAGVGYTIRYLGQGIDQVFGISGAIIAVLACIIGNFLGVLGYISDSEGLSYFDTLLLFDYSYTFQVLAETAHFMDLVFYGIAGYEGYKFAFRQLNQAQLAALK
ncbi:hypothetical protein [Algoriphagus litoralis]|uniref:hypothetical protein n=1 Tax=Algoriphagus litoralis TaxID=2202829 RepID=UPI001E29A7AA|nr:hypothetical protein [Algoriphagus litoralis]